MDTIVRISQITLNNFKNTQYGIIEMPSVIKKDFLSKESDILGIYGQNGSGKTAIIEAMEFIQTLLIGNCLPDETLNYISKTSESFIISVKFTIQTDIHTTLAEYLVEISKRDADLFQIAHESLSAATWNGEKFGTKKTLIDFSSTSDNTLFIPKYRCEALIHSNENNKLDLSVARKISQRDHCSSIFGNEGRSVFLSAPNNISEDYSYIINSLYHYANLNLFVISNAHSGTISVNFLIPFAFRLAFGEKIAKGDIAIRLDEPTMITEEKYQILLQIIAEMNVVLCTIIPGISIQIHDFGDELLKNGMIGHKIELTSKRGETVIPLKYESEGIVKIVSVLNVLMCIYTNPSMCLIIDELDAGIYEYLLGELLSVFEKSAKGQLIFTSHNLRALEMLDKKSIIFSTTNPANRYIRLQNVKSNNNLRDVYLRSIALGGQIEDVYEETDSVEIGRAFRRASKVVK